MARIVPASKENLTKKASKHKSSRIARRKLHSTLGVATRKNNKTGEKLSRKKVHIYAGPTICNVSTNIRIVASGKSNEELYVI